MITRPSVSMMKSDSKERGLLHFDGRIVYSTPKHLGLLDGVRIESLTYDENAATLKFTMTDGTSVSVSGFLLASSLSALAARLKGPPGVAGRVGDPGKDGKHGTPGVQGYQGQRGPVGQRGHVGIDGPSGDSGDQGPPGEYGHTGVVGDFQSRGTKGRTGDVGDPGKDGAVNVIISLKKPSQANIDAKGTLWVEDSWHP